MGTLLFANCESNYSNMNTM